MDQSHFNRQIRIFVSSTFKDMQAERNYLMTKTFPRLRRLAHERNVSLIEVDLRWGITKEKEGQSGKVVYTCLKEIEQAHPFFIGLLGSRYGWCPTKEDIMKSADFLQNYSWIADDIDEGLSITEIEIQYGVLRRKDPVNAFFYIKKENKNGLLQRLFGDKDSKSNRMKLKRLKEIVKSSKYKHEEFVDLDDLGDMVERDFNELLDRLYPIGENDEWGMFQLKQQDIVKRYSNLFVGRERNLKQIDEYVAAPQEQALVIYGPEGCGKSALLAQWIKERQQINPQRIIVFRFIKEMQEKTSWPIVLRSIVDELRYITGEPAIDWKTTTFDARIIKSELEQLLSINEQRHPIIVIDGIDAMEKSFDLENLEWLPQMPANAHLIVSTVEINYQRLRNMTEGLFLTKEIEVEWEIGLYIMDKQMPRVQLEALTLEERTSILRNRLLQHSKELGQEQLNRILQFPLTENPQILHTLIDELLTFGVYERLDEHIDYFISSPTERDFYIKVLKRYEQDYGKRLVRDALCLLALSDHGLSEFSIQFASQARTLEWSQLRSVLTRHLSMNELIRYSNNGMRDAVHDYMLSPQYDEEQIGEGQMLITELFAYFKSLISSDTDYGSFGMYLLKYLFLADEERALHNSADPVKRYRYRIVEHCEMAMQLLKDEDVWLDDDIAELTCQYRELGLAEKLYLLIIQPECFMYFIQFRERWKEYAELWRWLMEQNKARYNLYTVIPMIEEGKWDVQTTLQRSDILYSLGSVVTLEMSEVSSVPFFQAAQRLSKGSIIDKIHESMKYVEEEPQRALDIVNEAIRMAKDSQYIVINNYLAIAYVVMGRAFMSMNRLSEALDILNKVLSLELGDTKAQSMSNAHLLIGLIENKRGLREKGLTHLKEARDWLLKVPGSRDEKLLQVIDEGINKMEIDIKMSRTRS